MRFAVYGAGGAGGFFGALLARVGHEVGFVARGSHLEAIRARGLEVVGPTEETSFRVTPFAASDDPAEIGPVDVVLVGVKSWQVAEVAPRFGPLLGSSTAVVPLQNGVESADRLAAAVGEGPVLGGLCATISFVDGPGTIRTRGARDFIKVGERAGGPPSPRALAVRDAFAGTGIHAEVPEDIDRAVWEKFLFVVGWGGLAAVARVPVGVLRTQPETRSLLVQGMEEIEAIARARGIALAPTVVDDTMRFVDRLPPTSTPSLQRDVAAGRPSELDDWTGAVVRLGEATGVPTPVARMLHQVLVPLERMARGDVA